MNAVTLSSSKTEGIRKLQLQESVFASFTVPVDDDGEEETSDFYRVPRSFQIPIKTDPTKSTAEELEQITLLT